MVTKTELLRRAMLPFDSSTGELTQRGPLATRSREGANAFRAALDTGATRRRSLLVPGVGATEAVLGVLDAGWKNNGEPVLIDVFSADPDERVAALQVDVIEAAFIGVMAVALAPDFVDNDPRLAQAVELSLSGNATGLRVREVLLGRKLAIDTDFAPPRRRRPRNVDPDTLPVTLRGVPLAIPPDLLRDAARFARAGCYGSLVTALVTVGNAVASQSSRYRVGAHIDSFTPPDACPGNTCTVDGTGFGPATDGGIVFTDVDERPVVINAADCQAWSDTQIIVDLPANVGKGPVGIVSIPAVQGAQVPSTLAADAIAEAQTCLGPIAGGRLAEIIGKVDGPVLSLPPLQPDRLNYFAGGQPKIHAFYADRTILWPGSQVTLRWIVEGASTVQIVAAPPGTPAHELPPITGTLDPQSGTITVTVPGTSSWEGRYILRASNACTGGGFETAEVSLQMVIRRGLALGGGGSRGDFQVGALLYLYNEKNIRPDAIASTSVGSVNAAELVMGDDATGNGAARLETIWRGLTGNSSMWVEEPWLTRLKNSGRQLIRSLSLEGLIALPYSLVAGGVAVKEINDELERGPVAFFNISPIETLMLARFSSTRAEASGIQLRLVAVSLETSEVIQIDQTGAIISRETPTAQRSTVIDGAMASAAMPSIFPARRIGDHMCVDGGVRDVVPVQIAVEDLGCNEVYAISLSAPLAHLPFKQNRGLLEVAARSLTEIVFDEITDDDLAPFRGWGDSVTVHFIESTLNIHDSLTIDPGLIDIAIWYGWMRAGDMLDTPAPVRRRARELSDEITRLRALNWDHAFRANGDYVRNRHGSFPILEGAFPSAPSPIRPSASPEAVDDVRANCTAIRNLVLERLSLGAPTPPTAVRSRWWTQWETIPGGPLGTPWDAFTSVAGTRPAATPPPVV